MIEFNTSTLQEAIAAVLPVVAHKSPNLVFQNILIEAADGHATFRASDGDISAAYESECKPSKHEKMLLPAAKFAAIVKEAPPGVLTLTEDNGKVTVKYQGGKSVLQTADPEEFPDTPTFVGTADLPSGEVLKALQRCSPAMSQDAGTARYALAGMSFDLRLPAISATDTKALATQSLSVKSDSFAVLPEKAVNVLRRTLEPGGVVSMCLTEKSASFQCGALTLFCRCLEGRFPNIAAVLSPTAEYDKSFTILAGPLLKAIRQVAVTTAETSLGCDMTISGGVLRLATQAADVGKSEVEVPIDWQGEFKATFSSRYLAELVATVPQESTLLVKVNDEETPLRIDVDGTTFLVMPMTLDK